jgi:hypothetical protein
VKYFLLTLVLILSSCSLNKNSTYWNHDQETSRVQNINWIDHLSIKEFKTKLDDFAINSPYPNLNN